MIQLSIEYYQMSPCCVIYWALLPSLFIEIFCSFERPIDAIEYGIKYRLNVSHSFFVWKAFEVWNFPQFWLLNQVEFDWCYCIALSFKAIYIWFISLRLKKIPLKGQISHFQESVAIKWDKYAFQLLMQDNWRDICCLKLSFLWTFNLGKNVS